MTKKWKNMQNKSFINRFIVTQFKLCTYKATFQNRQKKKFTTNSHP